MGKFTHYVRVAIAEAEHLLHEAHSPREIVLGFTEDVLRAIATGSLDLISQPPVGTPVATPDTRDAEIAAQRAQLAAYSAAIDAQIARLTAAQAPVAVGLPQPVVTPAAPAPVATLDPSVPSIPQTTPLPTTLPLPVPKAE